MHHARLYIGTFTDTIPVLEKHEQISGADVRHIELARLGIDEARALAHEASLRPVESDVRVFVIGFKQATHEAQNALLKTLEEPVATSRFCIIVPREDALIPTVRSRLMLMTGPAAGEHSAYEASQTFMQSPYLARLEMIAERTKNKDDGWVRDVLDGLEVYASVSGDRSLIADLLMVRSYIESRGASKKMLLEQLALTLPRG